MKNTIVAVLVSFLAVTSAVDIKQKLKELRDPANIKREVRPVNLVDLAAFHVCKH